MDRVRRGAGPACIAGVVLGALVVGAVAGGFADLHVYRYGGSAVLHQSGLDAADDPVTGYPFTYPPFAALLMVPLAVLPSAAAAALWTGASVGALLATIAVVLRVQGRPTHPGVVAALGVAALALPRSGLSYWTDGLLDARRVGPPALAHNQSVYGALTRLAGEPVSTWLWLVVAAPVAIAVLAVAARWWPGDRTAATCLAATAMLVPSPVSWSHHWVWAVPIALVLWDRDPTAALAWAAVFVARPIVWPPWGQGREYGWGWFEQVPGNAYLLAALALTVVAARALNRPGRPLVSPTGRCG